MPDSNSTVDTARKMLEKRHAELHSEIADIEKALSALGGKIAKRAGSAASRAGSVASRGTKRRGRPAGSTTTTKAPTKTRRRRRRRGGTRSEQAVTLITDSPGLSASEIASQLGIKPNYMYRVLSELEGEKKIRKDGRKYYPAK